MIVEFVIEIPRGIVLSGRALPEERALLCAGARVTLRLPDGRSRDATVSATEDFSRLISGPGPEPRTFAMLLAGAAETNDVPRGTEVVPVGADKLPDAKRDGSSDDRT